MSRPLSLVLHIGSRGPDVERVQGALKARGFFQGETNGLFGADTETAVQNFQRQSGLRVDGTVGPETRSALLRDEKLEEAAQAAIHASAQATAVPGGVGVGVGGVGASQPVPPPVIPVTPTAPAEGKGLLIIGGLLVVGVLLMFGGGEAEPQSFDSFEDDNGLPPLAPGLDDEDDETNDATTDDTDDGADPGADSPTALAGTSTPVETDIVPFGGGAPLKRGAGGKFLPRGA